MQFKKKEEKEEEGEGQTEKHIYQTICMSEKEGIMSTPTAQPPSLYEKKPRIQRFSLFMYCS